MDHVGVRVRRGVDLSEVDLAHDREIKRDVRHLGFVPRSVAEEYSIAARTREGVR